MDGSNMSNTQRTFKSILEKHGTDSKFIQTLMNVFNERRKRNNLKQMLNNAKSAQQSNYIIMALFFIVMIAIIVTVTLTVSGFCNMSDLNYDPIILIVLFIVFLVCYKW
jgi:hypothetical protein